MIYYLKPGDTLLTIDGSNGHTVYQDYALTKEIPLGIYTDNVNIFQLSEGNKYNIWSVIELPSNSIPTPTPISLPIQPIPPSPPTIINNFTEIKSVYIGYPDLYTSNNDVYDRILNKFSNAANEITSIYTSNGLNLGSNIYRTSSGSLFETGYLAYFVDNILKKVKITNGVVTEIESDVTVSPVINPSTTKILSPFKHYESGNYIGTGYALYDNDGNHLFFMSKLEIAADGLTIHDSAWGNSLGTSKYWKFNKEIVSTTPLSTPYRIPEIYKGTVVEIQIVVLNTNNPGSQNSFSYSLLIAK